MNFYSLFWSIAARFDPETIHHISLQLLHLAPNLASIFPKIQNTPIKGHHFEWRNSLGIAAGLDKNALALEFWDKLGIGCIEVGTVTPKPQYGNDRPRIFRINHNNLVNAMGFPSDGASAVFNRILKFKTFQKSSMALWVNLGKQRDTPIIEAHLDYNFLIKKFAPIADALVINISSPNTADLRLLQSESYLENLLMQLAATRDHIKKDCPLLLKVSPDEKSEFYLQLPSQLKKYGWQGVIATNTTAQHGHGKGGLSGESLFPKSFEVAKILSPACRELKLDFIFVGGLANSEQLEKLRSQFIDFFQVYSSFIYHGPAVFTKIGI